MMTEKLFFGRRVKTLRAANGWTQEVLAEKININPNYLSSIERGKENPTFDMLVKFSKALNIKMNELFEFQEEVGGKELKKELNILTKEIAQDKIKLAVKILRAILR